VKTVDACVATTMTVANRLQKIVSSGVGAKEVGEVAAMRDFCLELSRASICYGTPAIVY